MKTRKKRIKNIFIADDHSIVRQGLKQILRNNPYMTVNGEAENGRELLDKIEQDHWDVLLLDISMPGKNGLDLLKEIKRRHPNLPVLMLSIYPEDQNAVRFLKAGASGYLNKSSVAKQLLEAIKKVLKGGRYVSPALAEKLAFDLEEDSEKPPHQNLSDREYQVLILIASGKTVSETAKDLSLSINTISTYRSRILEKLKLKTNANLTHYAFKNGLVE